GHRSEVRHDCEHLLHRNRTLLQRHEFASLRRCQEFLDEGPRRSEKSLEMCNFTTQSKLYAEFRPDYPLALFEFIAASAAGHQLAWDCATGSGQAAVGLARHFDRVIATDVSREQISNAK